MTAHHPDLLVLTHQPADDDSVDLSDLASEILDAPAIPPPVPQQRRRSTRRRVMVEVTLEGEHNLYTGFSLDLSEGGLFVSTYALLPVGTVCNLEFTLPGTSQPICAEARVRWVREHDAGSDLPPGMGLQFLFMDPFAHEQVMQFMARREPLFYCD